MPRSQAVDKSSSSSPSRKDTRQLNGRQGSRPDSSTDNDRYNDVETQRAIAKIASHAEGIKRLADVGQIVELLYDDVELIEGACRQAIEKERTIKKLRGTIEELTLVKSRETEKLTTENKDLQKEVKRLRNLEIQRRRENDAAEERRQRILEEKIQEQGRILKDEEAKLQKSAKLRKSELEVEYGKNVQRLEEENRDLTEQNKRLLADVAAIQEKQQEKKEKHTRERKSLMDEIKEYKSELEQIRSDFPNQTKPVEFQ